MIFTKNETLEDLLIRILLEEKTVTQIGTHPDIKKKGVTPQAIYKILRKLIDESVIVRHRKFYVTSREWLSHMQKLGTDTTIFIPSEGNKIEFTFSSFSQVDAYWKHAVLNLPEQDIHAPFFSYLPHNFWVHNPERFESEIEYYAGFETTRRDGFLVIGGDTPADIEAKKKLQNAYFRINTLAYPKFKRTEHIAVMGKFITTTKLSKPIARLIDHLYAEYIGEELILRLNKLFGKKTTIKITLENSEVKADKLRKILGGDFYIPKKK